MGDFADHMTTVFTDVRLKQFLEMRGADAGRPEMMLAQSALWVGLLYDDAALAAAEALLRGAGWQDAVAHARSRAAPGPGGEAALAGRRPARPGPRRGRHRPRRAARPGPARLRQGQDESGYLTPLEAIAAGAPTQAEHWLERFHGPWGGDVREIFAEAAI